MSKATALVFMACCLALAAAFEYPESVPNGWTGACQTGLSQSPIDIETDEVEQNTKVGRFRYWQPSLGTTSDTILKNNGHGIELELVDRLIQFQSTSFPLTYSAAQLHFHAPSEHTLNGQSFPLELHIVHFNANKQKGVVVGIWFEEGDKEDPLLAQIVPFLSELHDVGTSVEISFIPKIFIPDEFYEYEGSLTTPVCSEVVHWMVSTKPRTATKEQIEAFTEIMIHNGLGNNRMTKPLNGRTITKTKFLAGNPATTGPFQGANSIAPTFVETIIPAGNRVLLELSQGQLADSFGIHGSQIANQWTNPVDYADASGIDAQTAIVVAIGPDAMEGAEWEEGATVIVDLEDCETVGLNGLLYFLCEADDIYGELTVESWGANGADPFTAHLSDNDVSEWRHRTF